MPQTNANRVEEEVALKRDANTVGGRFDREKSLAAHAHDTKSKDTESANDVYYTEDEEVANDPVYTEELLRQERLSHMGALLSARRGNAELSARRNGKLVHIPKIGTFAKGVGFGAAVTICFWQFALGLISLIGMFGAGGIRAATGDSVLVNLGFKIIETLSGYDTVAVFEGMGMIFWGVTSLVAFTAFLAYALYYTALGSHIFETSLGMLLFFVCLALSMLPVSNLFPWLLLWVGYVFLKDAKAMVTGK